MTEMNLVIILALSTFGLVSLWMYQTKLEAEEGLKKKHRINDRRDFRSR